MIAIAEMRPGTAAARRLSALAVCLGLVAAAGSAWAAAGFRQMPAETTGLHFTNAIAPARYLTNQIYLNGSGVALGDVNGDDRPDVFVAGLAGSSALFLNLGGWRFTNVTRAAITFPASATPLDASGCVLADVTGDGALDLLFNTIAQGTWLLVNDGRGNFRPAGPALNGARAGMSFALADVDGDGDLDLYVANYRPVSMRDEPNGRFTIRDEGGRPRVIAYNGRPVTEPDLAGRFYVTPTGVKENGEPDALLLNDGRGGFTAVSWTGGTFLDEDGRALPYAPPDWGLSAMLRDLNGDGRPDLYVCNDFESPDRLWWNETPPGGPVRFRAAGNLVQRMTSAFSMGMDAADLNRDGRDDFLVLDMLSRDHRLRMLQVDGLPPGRAVPGLFTDVPQFSHNTLFLGRDDGTFAEIGRLAGLSASEWSWTPVFLDVDLDGWEDLLVSNGHEMEMMDADIGRKTELLKNQRRMSTRELLELRLMFRRFNAPNAAFRNRGNLAFEDLSEAWGFALPSVAHGLALADLDDDGDLDAVLNCLNDPLAVFRNEATAPRLAVRLQGSAPNTRGIGARITVRGGPVPEQSQVMISGGRYLSGDDAIRTFAAGPAGGLEVEVKWPSGKVSRRGGVKPDATVVLPESEAAPETRPDEPAPAPLFTEVSGALNHTHADPAFDAFARQPLLSRNAAFTGPGLTWTDLDNDGADDLVIGTGAGGLLAAFAGDGAGGFRRLTNGPLTRPPGRDLTTILPRPPALLAGSANYEDGRTNGGLIRVTDLARNIAGDSLLGSGFTVGPLAMGDVEGDGSLEIFVGGRSLPGRYPEPAPSLLVETRGGRFAIRHRFEALGLVNGAMFADVTGDHLPDLVIAAEWSPLRVFRNEGGRFTEATAALGLTNTVGWWHSVNASDFDEDGRLDLIAGNFGWNSFPRPRAPLDGVEGGLANRRRIRWGDLDGNGVVDLIESWFDDAGRELPVRKFDSVAAALPFLQERFTTRGAYGAATLGEIYGDRLAGLPMIEARWFATTVFLNRGDNFEPRVLPAEAQFAPVFGLAVADFDGDGHDDAFLAQNFFPLHPEEARQDAGRGLLLRGDGRGGLTPVPGLASGALVHGEGRGAAVADFNRDGRSDLAVGQNAAQTRLFRNDGARPGLRVKLLGPPENPDAIDARLQLFAGERGGPIREIRAGSGWLSVDSPTVVLTHAARPTTLAVRWPDGSEKRHPLPANAREITVAADGAVKVIQ